MCLAVEALCSAAGQREGQGRWVEGLDEVHSERFPAEADDNSPKMAPEATTLCGRVSGLSPVASRLEIGWPLPARHALLYFEFRNGSHRAAQRWGRSLRRWTVRHDLGAISDVPREGVART
jgi:hypothetical protein